MTLEQIARHIGRAAASAALRSMAAHGELDAVIPEVWAHAATPPATDGSDLLNAQAAWLALEPHLTLSERRQRYFTTAEPVPVIGGSAACAHWQMYGISRTSEVLVPTATWRAVSSDDVTIVVRGVHRTDVNWGDRFPYLRPEATIAWALDATGDLDRVATALQDAMWRLYPLKPEVLHHHVLAIAARNEWTDEHWNGEVLYQRLVEMAGGWPTQAR